MSNGEGTVCAGARPQPLAGKRVLVAEDAWHVAKALKGVLEDTGLEVLGPAASVHQAEEVLARTEPDLAIVDINLKGELSYALIDRLHDKGVPVIVATGYAQLTEPIGKSVVMLQKPFSGPALLAKVRELISGRTGA
jgi:DNA-binding response OmpR family regulator